MKRGIKLFFVLAFLAIATLAVPILFASTPFIAVALLVAITLGFFALTGLNVENVIVYLVAILGGPIAEAVAIHFGLWMYADPAFLGFPIWLPFVWGNAALYVLSWKTRIIPAFS